MKLPSIVQALIEAQNNFDSEAYASLFSETGVAYDEGKTHTGRREIQKWIADANEKYRSVMQEVEYEERGDKGILSAKVSGTFPGSPAMMKFHLETNDGLIQSLRITG